MAHAENKVDWCLRKAGKELKETGKHRGLVRIAPDKALALAHLQKAEHSLKAVTDFQKIGYSDWSASAAFYAVYHCLLAIAAKNGYESRNQECTFALIRYLIENKKVELDPGLLEKISRLDPEKSRESPTITDIREMQQYGVATSLGNDTLERALDVAKTVLDAAKECLED